MTHLFDFCFRWYTSRMKILVLYRPNSEHARKVEEFLHDLQRQHDIDQRNLQIIDVDSRDGMTTASIYDIMTSPAVVVTDNVGSYIQSWVGGDLPLMQDVAAYAYGG